MNLCGDSTDIWRLKVLIMDDALSSGYDVSGLKGVCDYVCVCCCVHIRYVCYVCLLINSSQVAS